MEHTLAAAVIIMFSCLWCLFPLSWSALIWCVRCLNMDLTVLYTKTSTTVPDNCGILGALRNQDPAVTKIVHSIVHKNQYFINCTQYCTQKLVLQSQTAGFWEQHNSKIPRNFWNGFSRPRDFGHPCALRCTGIFRRKAKGTDTFDNQKWTGLGYFVKTPGGLLGSAGTRWNKEFLVPASRTRPWMIGTIALEFDLLVPSRFNFCQQIWFLSADSVCRFLLSADLFFVSRFCQQIFLVCRFTFCQQILSAYFYSQLFQFLSEECFMFRLMERCQ